MIKDVNEADFMTEVVERRVSADEHEIVPESLAHRAPRPGFDEDDETLGQSLVSGGLEEAAHDQMLEARREGHETDET